MLHYIWIHFVWRFSILLFIYKLRSIILNAFEYVLNSEVFIVRTLCQPPSLSLQCCWLLFYIFICLEFQKSFYRIKYYWFGNFNAVMQSSASIILIHIIHNIFLIDGISLFNRMNQSAWSFHDAEYLIGNCTRNLLHFWKIHRLFAVIRYFCFSFFHSLWRNFGYEMFIDESYPMHFFPFTQRGLFFNQELFCKYWIDSAINLLLNNHSNAKIIKAKPILKWYLSLVLWVYMWILLQLLLFVRFRFSAKCEFSCLCARIFGQIYGIACCYVSR